MSGEDAASLPLYCGVRHTRLDDAVAVPWVWEGEGGGREGRGDGGTALAQGETGFSARGTKCMARARSQQQPSQRLGERERSHGDFAIWEARPFSSARPGFLFSGTGRRWHPSTGTCSLPLGGAAVKNLCVQEDHPVVATDSELWLAFGKSTGDGSGDSHVRLEARADKEGLSLATGVEAMSTSTLSQMPIRPRPMKEVGYDEG